MNKVDCADYQTDAIFRLETTGVHAITKSEELATEIKSHISESTTNDSITIQIEDYEGESTTFFVVEAPQNEVSARDLGEEFHESADYVAVRGGQSIRSVTEYVPQIEAWLESQNRLNESTSRISWPEPPGEIEATATIDGVSQMTDLFEEDLIQARVPMERGERTVFSTADLSSITSPTNLDRSPSIFFSFSTNAQQRVYERFRETNVITDSGTGDNELHYYISGEDVGAPKILPEAVEGWNETGRIQALGIPIEMADARRFYDRFPNLDVMDSDGTVTARFEIDLCE
ncbi:MAG: hypothetical protein ACQEQJ_00610 [Halobacteriota archaeon]